MIKENWDIFGICWMLSGIGFFVGGLVFESITLIIFGLGFIVLTFAVCFYGLSKNPITKYPTGDSHE